MGLFRLTMLKTQPGCLLMEQVLGVTSRGSDLVHWVWVWEVTFPKAAGEIAVQVSHTWRHLHFKLG